MVKEIYEIYPEYDGGDMDAELRVFVRLPEDADTCIWSPEMRKLYSCM